MQTELLFGIHCHQPIDNFDNVVLEIIEKSYKPFFNILKEYPAFKCSVHFSGWLLEYIQMHEPKLFALMQQLSPQLEFFTGGYYEPILASIPSRDRVEQINKLTHYIQTYFNQTPKGLWLTERIWDDSIIDDLVACHIEYVIVDDYHLIASGVSRENLKGYFITENSNNHIALFPIDQTLRYTIPFASIDKTIETLHTFVGEEGENAAIIFDDGEKFGVWPKTYEKVYEKEWLKNFFERCLADETIHVSTFNEYYTQQQAISLAYLPTVSYHEMGEWSVLRELEKEYWEVLSKNKGQEHLVRGGIWKNFFLKYQESNWIHKRMLELSKNRLISDAYLDALYRTQCNDVLWHGVFGGIYLPNLRDNAYKYIIECENIIDREAKCIVRDIDLDLVPEYKFYTPELITIINPKRGGQIVELDLRDVRFNYQNTLTRYPEHYHAKIEKSDTQIDEETATEADDIDTIHTTTLKTDEDIELYIDWYLKKSAVDHISDEHFDLELFQSCQFKEYGDFANQSFSVKESSQNDITLYRDGGIYDEKKYETTLIKQFAYQNRTISCHNALVTESPKELHYIVEWNLHFEDYEELLINESEMAEDTLVLQDSSLTITDTSLHQNLHFSFDEEVDIYIYKTKSISQSESGVDYTIQSITLGFVKAFSGSCTMDYTFSIEPVV